METPTPTLLDAVIAATITMLATGLGALPFVFIVLLLVVCLLKALKSERLDPA